MHLASAAFRAVLKVHLRETPKPAGGTTPTLPETHGHPVATVHLKPLWRGFSFRDEVPKWSKSPVHDKKISAMHFISSNSR
jgi:hypothetical protein